MPLLDANPLKFEQDFFIFLRYCFENQLKVTKTHLTFHRNDIHAINQLMSIPEMLKPNVFQWESHRIQLFSEIAQFLKLIGFDNKFSLVLSVPIDQILKYPPLHWFTIEGILRF